MTKRKQNKTKENKRAKEEKKIHIYIYIYAYKLLFMIRECFQLTAKGSGTCCISNFKTKRVKKFRTLETDGELSYISPAWW